MKKLMSHREANYRASVSTDKRCGTCTMYRRSAGESSCTIVAKPIRSSDICAYYEPKEKEDKHAG
jgi:hypothetical protein